MIKQSIIVTFLLLVVFGTQAQDAVPTDMLIWTSWDGEQTICGQINPDGENFSILDEYSLEIRDQDARCVRSKTSPDGNKRLDFRRTRLNSKYNYFIEVVNLPDETDRMILFEQEQFIREWLFVWLPDSRNVLVFNRTQQGGVNGYGELLKIDTVTGEITNIYDSIADAATVVVSTNEFGETEIDVSTDGQFVAFRRGEYYVDSTLFLVNTADGSTVDLTHDGSISPCTELSPQNTSIAYQFISPSYVTTNVSSANARSGPGSGYGVVTTFPKGMRFMVIGRQSGWVNVQPEEGRDVWLSTTIVDTESGFEQVILEDILTQETVSLGRGYQMDWSPDGESVAFVCTDEQAHDKLCKSDRTGTNITVLNEAEERTGFAHPQWSPDGQKIVYIQGSRSTSNNNKYTHVIHMYDLQTSTDYSLTTNDVEFGGGCGGGGSDYTWSPSGEWILYRAKLDSRTDMQYICNIEGCKTWDDFASFFPDTITDEVFFRWSDIP